MNTEASCLVCHSYPETIDHIIKDCNFTKDVLRRSPFYHKLITTQVHFHDWVCAAITSLENNEAAEFVAILYNIWSNRNEIVHSASSKPACIPHSPTFEVLHVGIWSSSRTTRSNRQGSVLFQPRYDHERSSRRHEASEKKGKLQVSLEP